MDPALIGGIAGGALGVLGGAIGTYFAVTRVEGPRERAFMARAAIIGWAALLLFGVGMLLIPMPYNFLLWVPYGIALPLAIRYGNAEQQRIRSEEAAQHRR